MSVVIAALFESHCSILASSHHGAINFFFPRVLRTGGKRKGVPRCSTADSCGPNKEILDKSREVFAVQRSCLHYSRASVFGYLVPRFSFHLVASVSSNLLPLESLRRRREHSESFYYGLGDPPLADRKNAPGILADLETIYARCIAGNR